MIKMISFKNASDLIPAIIQENKTGEILMLGYMNRLAYAKTKKTGWVYFWSRKRNILWMKGKISGNKLKVNEIYTDCDKDTLLIKAELIGENACHKGYKSCFYQKII